jgi:hypothetical protein
MFERIAIRQGSSASLGQPIDLGTLAEALIFYSDVRLILNRVGLEGLLARVPPDVILEFLDEGHFKLAYEADNVAIMSRDTDTPAETHEPVSFSMPHVEIPELLPKLLFDIYKKQGKARRSAKRLANKIDIIRHPPTFVEQARLELSDERYVQTSVETLMRTYVPEYQGPIRFVTQSEGSRIRVLSNIRFDEANSFYHKHVSPAHSSLSPAYLLAHLLSVKADLHFAAQYESELAIDPVNARIIQQHFAHLVSRLEISKQQVSKFQEFVFDDSRAVSQALRSGTHQLVDLLPIVRNAAKFKTWLQTEPVQKDVIKAYFRDAMSQTWVDKLQAKSVRWFLLTAAGIGIDTLGAGGVGTAVGAALGLADVFLLDKLLKGWKPNQFVDDYLATLVHHKT